VLEIMQQKQLIKAMSKLIGIGVFSIQAAQAGGTITVDSISDQSQAGLTSLREAIVLANSSSESTIAFDEALFSEPQTIILDQGELIISSSTTIVGPGSELLTIDGDNRSRVMTVDDGDNSDIQQVEISGLTFTNGNGTSKIANNRGGCILSFESLTLNESVITGCESNVDGGGVWSRYGTLSLNNTTVSNNTANFKGGGVYTREAPANISNSTVSGNSTIAGTSSSSRGAGLYLRSGGEVSVSTISNNLSMGNRSGGIEVYSNATLVIVNSTIFNNQGVGIFPNSNNTFLISNSIIAANSEGDCDFTEITDQSANQNNLDSDGSCNVFSINHLTVDNPMLEPLAFYGGPTKTHRPKLNSPVVDVGDDSLCELFDQRGEIRPQDGDANGSAICDIGAVELTVFEDIIFVNGFDD
jgi:hypothetical protein